MKIIRLQIQTAPLKAGGRGERVYDPAPLQEVEALEVGPRGCFGLLGTERLMDVHHADHPQTRNRDLANGLSLLPPSSAAKLVALYGLDPSLAGVAVHLDDELPAGDLLVETDGEPLRLTAVEPAPPCVEFSRYCLGLEPSSLEGVDQALRDLGDGVRGFYAVVLGSGVIRLGAAVRPV